jgi:hypothetical protein
MAENEPPALDPEISTAIAAGLLKMSVRHFLRLASAGWIKKNERGRYTLVAVVHGFVDYSADLAKQAGASARNDAVTARAEEIKLKILQRQRELIKTDDVLSAVDVLLAKIRDAIAGVPAGFTRDREERKRLEDLVNGVLNRIADECGRLATNLQKGRIVLPRSDANDKRRVGDKKPRLSKK